jgi:glycerophosphoryl diester phosphodiesterase
VKSSSRPKDKPVATHPSNRVSCPLLLGHRGLRNHGFRRLSGDLPAENSLAAFEFALSQGCDGFEFDVRHTRDVRNVLWHDPDWNGRQISATDYSDLIDNDGDHLACLEEVLQQLGHRAYLDIELKVAGREESVIAATKANRPLCGFIVSSFFPDVITRLESLDSGIPLGFICDRFDAMHLWRELPIKVFLPRHDFVQPKLIDEVHQSGHQIMTWTVNSPRRMQELATWGIDGLISDDPTLMYQTFHIE